MRRQVTLDSLPLFRFCGSIAGMVPVSVRRSPTPGPTEPRAGQQFGANTASEATAMIKSLLYMAPIALVGLVATEAPAATAAWSGGTGRNIAATAPEGTGVPLVLECQRGAEAVAAAVLALAAVLAAGAAVLARAVAVLAAVVAVPGPVPAAATSVAPVRTAGTSTAPMRTA